MDAVQTRAGLALVNEPKKRAVVIVFLCSVSGWLPAIRSVW